MPAPRKKNGELNGLIIRLRDIKASIKQLTAQKDGDEEHGLIGVEPTLVEMLEQMGQNSAKAVDDLGIEIIATGVWGSRETIDADKLKKALGAALWAKVTTPQLDKAKLEDLMAKGVIDAHVVASCSEEKANKPYIRITEKAKTTTTERNGKAAATGAGSRSYVMRRKAGAK